MLLTKATVEEGALSTRRSRGKQSLEGSLSLVPCPFKESVLVPLHSAVQQDVLQVSGLLSWELLLHSLMASNDCRHVCRRLSATVGLSNLRT